MPRFVVNRWPVNRRHEGQQSEVIEAEDFGAALEAAYWSTGHGIQFEVFPDPTPEPPLPLPPPLHDPEPETPVEPDPAPESEPVVTKLTRTRRKKEQ